MSVNVVVLVGRLATDVTVREISENVRCANFTLAVDKRFKRKGADKPGTDFIKISVIGAGAAFAEKYYEKGKQVSVVGSIDTYEREKEGVKIYDFCVKADQLGFADSASGNKKNQNNQSNQTENSNDGFTDFEMPGDFAVPPAGFEDDDLPF